VTTTSPESPGRPPRTDADRQRALSVYRREGTLAATVRETGLPRSTVKRWVEQEGQEKSEPAQPAVGRTAVAIDVSPSRIPGTSYNTGDDDL
jgi:hypothetical protein